MNFTAISLLLGSVLVHPSSCLTDKNGFHIYIIGFLTDHFVGLFMSEALGDGYRSEKRDRLYANLF